jgi:DNA mismatch repair ATPase MutL
VTLNLLSQEEQAAFMFDKYEAGAAVMKAGYLHKLIVGKLVQCFTDKQLAVPKKLRTLSAGDGFLQISSFHTFVTDQLVKQHEYAHNQLLASLPAYRQDQERKAQAILNPPASSSSPKKSPKKSPASSPNKSPNRSPNKSHASSSSPNQGTKRPAAAADAGPSNPRKSPKKRSQVQSTLNFA